MGWTHLLALLPNDKADLFLFYRNDHCNNLQLRPCRLSLRWMSQSLSQMKANQDLNTWLVTDKG